MERAGPAALDLRAGQNLSLPVVPGRDGTLPPANREEWSAILFRGDRFTTIGGSGPLPSPLVVPWMLIPDTPGEKISVRVTSTREFSLLSTGDPTVMFVTAGAFLEWNVRVVP